MKKIMLFLLLYCSITSLQAQQKTNIPPKSIDTLQAPPTDTLRKKLMAMSSQQQDGNIPNIIPPSPQSQIFEKYVNHAITEYNGLPDISIPLYEIEIKGLKIPITLNYHAAGIKYRQYDGDVGAGWSINAGGYRITRTVHGKSDFDYPLCNKIKIGDEILNPIRFDLLYAFIALYPSQLLPFSGPFSEKDYKYADGEYDIFTYITPSTDGHFIITDRDNNTATSIEQKLDKINISKSDGHIFDDKGFQYFFGGKNEDLSDCIEKTSMPKLIKSPVTAWPLKKIVSPYNETIKFDYNRSRDVLHFRYPPFSYTSISLTNAAVGEVVSSVHPIDYKEEDKSSILYNYDEGFRSGQSSLKKIEGEKEIIHFKRTDTYKDTPHLISEIIITTKDNKPIRKIIFNYNVSPNGANTENYEKPWHILLDSIRITSENQTEKKYEFKYYTPPSKPSYPDFWDYYAFSSLAADKLLFLDERFANDDFVWMATLHLNKSTYHREKFKNIVAYNKFFIDRSVDTDNLHSFSLKKIIYPTGGYTEYMYEPNAYFDSIENVVVQGGGQRIKKIKSHTADSHSTPITSVFKYGHNENGYGIAPVEFSYENFKNIMENISFYSFYERWSILLEYKFKRSFESMTYSVSSPELSSLFKVHYPEISICQYDDSETNYNGKTISSYTIPQPYVSARNMYKTYIAQYRLGLKPTLFERKIYNEKNSLINIEKYTYTRTKSDTYNNLDVYRAISMSGDDTWEKDYPDNIRWNFAYNHIHSFFSECTNYIITGIDLLSSKTTTLKTDNGDVVSRENYAYDNKYRLIKTSQANSRAGLLTKDFTYPAAGSALDSKNMVSTVIEQIVKNNNVEIERTRTNYPTSTGSLPLPQSVQKSHTGAGGYVTELTYNHYDNRGNLLQYTGRDGVPVSFAWGYNRQYPVAKVVGATFQEIKTALAESSDDLTGIQSLTSDDLKNKLNDIRTHLNTTAKAGLNAQISTYTYKPLVGMDSETDPNGITSTFEYDTFGRLIRILDNEGKVLKQFEYNYKK